MDQIVQNDYTDETVHVVKLIWERFKKDFDFDWRQIISVSHRGHLTKRWKEAEDEILDAPSLLKGDTAWE